MIADALKRLLRRYSRNRILTRRLPRRYGVGRIFVTPDAALSFWYRDLDRSNGGPAFATADRYVRPGDVVFDIGANQGLFSFAAAIRAGPAGHIVALEPDPFFAHLIQRSLPGLPTDRAPIQVYPAAAAAGFGVAAFSVAAQGRASSHLSAVAGRVTAGGARQRYEVLTLPLDWLAATVRVPTLVKIDVEGAETLALSGSGELLRRHRPRWIVEVVGETAPAVLRLFREADYTVTGSDGEAVPEPSAWAGDLYAVPRP